jgi:hypothetical protein
MDEFENKPSAWKLQRMKKTSGTSDRRSIEAYATAGKATCGYKR